MGCISLLCFSFLAFQLADYRKEVQKSKKNEHYGHSGKNLLSVNLHTEEPVALALDIADKRANRQGGKKDIHVGIDLSNLKKEGK